MEELKQAMFGKKPLTDEEFQAVREWFVDHQDEFGGDLKRGLEKLVNNEEKDRLR